jgi:integrase
VLVGAGTGLRPGELFGLALDRVDFLRRTLRVDQQLVRVPGGVALAPLKTKASYRTLPLPDVVVSALAAHLAEWPAHPGLGVVFTNVRGGPIQAYPFAALWNASARRADLPEWATPHDYADLRVMPTLRDAA